MDRNRLLAIAGPVVGKKKLPFSDSFARADGAPGLGWAGTAGVWTISSNKLSNTPGLGAEVLGDPGLETAYVAGLCSGATKYGTPTVAESADAHGGTKAQQFTATALNDRVCFDLFNGVARTWYLYTLWGKRTAGAAGNVVMKIYQNTGSSFHYEAKINDAAYTQKKITYYSPGTGQVFAYLAQDLAAGPFDTVISDDGSFKPLTLADLFLTRPASQSNVIVKAAWAPDTLGHTHCGVVARLDSRTNPQNYLLALVTRDKSNYQWSTLHKVVGGVLTTLITNSDTPYVAGAFLEIRCTGTTVKLYYNNAQVGADQTVNDAGILNNSIHGVFSTDGGNKLNRFFLGYA